MKVFRDGWQNSKSGRAPHDFIKLQSDIKQKLPFNQVTLRVMQQKNVIRDEKWIVHYNGVKPQKQPEETALKHSNRRS